MSDDPLKSSQKAYHLVNKQEIAHNKKRPKTENSKRSLVHRVAVIQRGEAALRFLKTAEIMQPKIEAVLLYTHDEMNSSVFWSYEHRQILEGGAEAYMDPQRVLTAIHSAHCDSAWLGWGFASEQADFVEALEREGINVLAPRAETLAELGDKGSALKHAQTAGFKLIPSELIDLGEFVDEYSMQIGHKDFSTDQALVSKLENQITQKLKSLKLPPKPWLLKATEGGGGRGIFSYHEPISQHEAQKVTQVENLPNAGKHHFIQWLIEKTFSVLRMGLKPRFLLETQILEARHIELQLLGDGHGKAIVIGARECSVQRRKQKLIEECPPQNINEDRLKAVELAAIRLGQNLKYRGVGTVEMLYNPAEENFYFLEVNPRLQVEHPITEMVYGIDLVEAQINVVLGKDLPELSMPRGVAIEARLYAEDYTQDFVPTSGQLVKFRIPAGPGIRVDSGYQEGDFVVGQFDPMLAKVIAHAPKRLACVMRLKQALASTQILIKEGASNHHYLKEILGLSDFQESRWHTQKLYQNEYINPRLRGVALLAKAIDLYLSQIESSEHFASKAFLLADHLSLRVYRIGLESFLCVNDLSHLSQQQKLDVKIPIQWTLVNYRILNDCARSLTIDQHSYHVESIIDEEVYWIDGQRFQLSNQAHDTIIAPSKAVVLEILVSEGQSFVAGQTLIKLEAMKVELSIVAPRAGHVGLIYCELEQVVESGEALIAMTQTEISDEKTEVIISWNEDRLESMELFHATMGFWDYVPSDLWNELPQTFTPSQVKSILADTQRFIDLAKLFDRRSNDKASNTHSLGVVSAQPLRFIKAYLAGEASSLPMPWLTHFKTCLAAISQISPRHILLDSIEEWASLRLIRNASQLNQIALHLGDFLTLIDEIPQNILDQLGALDPIRFPNLVGLAAERSARLSQQLLAKATFSTITQRWLLGEKISISEQRQLNSEAMLNFLMFYAQEHKVMAIKALLETLIFTDKTRTPSNYLQPVNTLYVCALSKSLTEVSKRLNESFRESSIEYEEDLHTHNLCLIYDYKSETENLEDLALLVNEGLSQIKSIKPRIYLLDLSQFPVFEQPSEDSELHSTQASLTPLRADLKSCITRLSQTQLATYFSKNTEVIVVGTDQPKLNTESNVFNQTVGLSVCYLYYNCMQYGSSELHESHESQFTGSDFGSDFTLSQGSYFEEKQVWRDLSPKQIQRLNVQRWSRFNYERCFVQAISNKTSVSSADHSIKNSSACFKLTAIENPKDIRFVTYAEVYQLKRRRGRPLVLPEVDHAFYTSLQLLHAAQRDLKHKLHWNRLIIHILPVIPLGLGVIKRYMSRLVSAAQWLGLEKVIVRARFIDKATTNGMTPLMDVSIYQFAGREVSLSAKLSDNSPIMTRTQYESQIVLARQRGLTHPAEVIHLLEGGGSGVPRGHFTLFSYDSSNQVFHPTEAEPIFGALNHNSANLNSESRKCGVLMGEICTEIHKPQMTLKRIVILCDPTVKLAALGREECNRIIAALRYAHTAQLPVEWLSVSSGAKIDWETGTENLDACAKVLKEIIRFTKAGGMINILVIGTSVGAQSYWNAEATMMNHCSGTLIMTNQASMVLTGKKALDLSGCVSASDDLELGGYSSIMGPNGQAQMHAVDLIEAYQKLYIFYRLCYVEAHSKRVKKRLSKDPIHRDLGESTYPEYLNHGFNTVADIFSEQNLERKKPFAIQPIMSALKDQDDRHLERWGAWEGAETVVVWQSRVGGFACTMIGIENRPIQRISPSLDGPKQWQGGTLYPQASRKLARAINASRGRYPVIILANLSGFDGSPESLRQGQLEYGSEIAQAVQGFDAPIYFVIMSRYHGGAYVVFSKKLNHQLESIAITGSYASVIGGGPAASLIFKKDVNKLQQEAHTHLSQREAAKIIAEKFDQTHNIQRALSVGSIDSIIDLSCLRETLCKKLALDYEKHHSPS